MITQELLKNKIAESQEKINSWVMAINQETARMTLCEQLLKEFVAEEVTEGIVVPEGFQPAINDESQVDG